MELKDLEHEKPMIMINSIEKNDHGFLAARNGCNKPYG
jgi:hypothetical protein